MKINVSNIKRNVVRCKADPKAKSLVFTCLKEMKVGKPIITTHKLGKDAYKFFTNKNLTYADARHALRDTYKVPEHLQVASKNKGKECKNTAYDPTCNAMAMAVGNNKLTTYYNAELRKKKKAKTRKNK